MNTMQYAVIRKDIKGITDNRNLFIAIITVPLVMAVFVPSLFILMAHFMPQDLNDFDVLLQLLPIDKHYESVNLTIISLLLNNIMPVFFVMIPIMASSIMAASAFVGEKEKRTLETLLYCPLTLKEIFQAKVMAAVLLSGIVTLAAFIVMVVVTQVEIFLTMGRFLLPGPSWLVVLLVLAPALSFIAITLIVKGSAKAKTMEEAQQRSTFLVLPVVFLMVGQFTGVLLVNLWILLALGVVLAVVAWLLVRGSFQKVSYESLLR